MPVISLLNQKGGVGKTTLSLHLAMALSQQASPSRRRSVTRHFARVLLVDADPQESALDWRKKRDENPTPFRVIALPTCKLHLEIGPMSHDYDYVVIDGPPGVSPITRSAVGASDLVIIPVQPSPYDVWAAEEVERIISECSITKPILAYFLINRQFPNTTMAKEVSAALLGRSIPVMHSVIRNRTAYAKAATKGLTVLEEEGGLPSDAVVEIREWTKEVCAALQQLRLTRPRGKRNGNQESC